MTNLIFCEKSTFLFCKKKAKNFWAIVFIISRLVVLLLLYSSRVYQPAGKTCVLPPFTVGAYVRFGIYKHLLLQNVNTVLGKNVFGGSNAFVGG